MTIKLELTKERTQRELSEEEWAFPIWRWAAFSLFDTLILVIIIILTLLLPAFALIVESLLFSKGYPLLSIICSCLIFVSATVLFVYSLSIVPDFWSFTIYSYMLYLLFNIGNSLRKINRIINLRQNNTKA